MLPAEKYLLKDSNKRTRFLYYQCSKFTIKNEVHVMESIIVF